MLSKFTLLAALTLASAGAGGGFAFTYTGGASNLVSSSQPSALADRLIGRTLSVTGCSKSSIHFGQNYVADMVGSEVFNASHVTYQDRDGLVGIERQTATEIYDVGSPIPHLVAIDFEGVMIRPPERPTKECSLQSEPQVSQDDLKPFKPLPYRQRLANGALMAMMFGDQDAVRQFMAKGVTGDDQFNGKTLRDWARMSAPSFVRILG